jgi:hypothetical protein
MYEKCKQMLALYKGQVAQGNKVSRKYFIQSGPKGHEIDVIELMEQFIDLNDEHTDVYVTFEEE